MDKFDLIIENIQKELLVLKEINQSLRDENASLREQQGMSVNNNDIYNISLSEASDNFSIVDDYFGRKTRMISCFSRAGYKNLGDFKDKSIHDLIKVKNAGIISCAVLIVLLEHYDIHIDMSSDWDDEYQNMIKKISEEILRVREKMVFKK